MLCNKDIGDVYADEEVWNPDLRRKIKIGVDETIACRFRSFNLEKFSRPFEIKI